MFDSFCGFIPVCAIMRHSIFILLADMAFRGFHALYATPDMKTLTYPHRTSTPLLRAFWLWQSVPRVEKQWIENIQTSSKLPRFRISAPRPINFIPAQLRRKPRKSEWQDLNLQSPKPKSGALPNCATFRFWQAFPALLLAAPPRFNGLCLTRHLRFLFCRAYSQNYFAPLTNASFSNKGAFFVCHEQQG